jgi:hypothetical protein
MAWSSTNCEQKLQMYEERWRWPMDQRADYGRRTHNTTLAATTGGHTLRAMASSLLSIRAYPHTSLPPRQQMAPHRSHRPKRASRGRSRQRRMVCRLNRAQNDWSQRSMEMPWTSTRTGQRRPRTA